MLVGQIAWEQCTPIARERVGALVGTLEATYNEGQPYNFITAGCWMDDMRSKKGYAWGKWHYVNVPWSADGSAFELPPPPHIVWAIEGSLATLRTADVAPEKAAEALAMVIHFIGDIHQPMHATDRGDRGGNGVLISGVPFTDLWNGTVPNLHAYWDAAFRFDQGEDEKVLQVWLSPTIAERPKAAGEGIIAAEAAKITARFPPSHFANVSAAKTAEAWARESHTLGCKFAYPVGSEASDHSLTPITPDFAHKSRRLAQERIALAGYRLAELLNEIYGSKK
jgi:hypothetical protein